MFDDVHGFNAFIDDMHILMFVVVFLYDGIL
jgi:hypothetical protein